MAAARYSSWKEIHNELLKLPFCHNRQQLVRIIICLDYIDCRWEGLCYPCFEQGIEPFCPEMERLVHIIVCVTYMHCCCGGFCYPCYKQEEILHEITISVPDIIDLTLIKFCTDMFEEFDHNY